MPIMFGVGPKSEKRGQKRPLSPGCDPGRVRHGAPRARKGILSRLFDALKARVPLGYEDQTGFHYGAEQR
jgi:hypothetical protein